LNAKLSVKSFNQTKQHLYSGIIVTYDHSKQVNQHARILTSLFATIPCGKMSLQKKSISTEVFVIALSFPQQ